MVNYLVNRERVCPRGTLFTAALLVAVLLDLGGAAAYADTLISVQFQCNNVTFCGPATPNSGVEPDAASADPNFSSSNVWNQLGAAAVQPGPVSFANLMNSAGIATTAAIGISNIAGGANFFSEFPDTTVQSYTNATFTITGLAPNMPFTLFLYAYNGGPILSPFLASGDSTAVHVNDETFTVPGSSFDTANATTACLTYGPPCENSEDPDNVSDGYIYGMTDSSGVIAGTWTKDATNTGSEAWSGFQLDVGYSPAAPEPAAWCLMALGICLLLGFYKRRRA